MSGWKLVTQELNKRGGVATHSRQFDAGQHRIAVTRAIILGLIAHPSKRAPYTITDKGKKWLSGELKYIMPNAKAGIPHKFVSS